MLLKFNTANTLNKQGNKTCLNKNRAQISHQRQKIFKFNKVFTHIYSQQEVFNQTQMPMIVNKVIDGYHSTIFAYGQTGSGKTYTVQGLQNSQQEGLIPRAIRLLFKQLSQKDHNERSYKVFISYLQIYNQNIYDLIDAYQNKPLKLRWNKYQQFIVQDLFQGQCRSYEQAIKWWRTGKKNKIMGSHKMNKVSSRSHCILTLRVTSYQFEDPSNTLESKLQIIDLAGSQRHKVTKSSGIVFKQGVQINKSLFTLRQVINALYQVSSGQSMNRHIPYRQSKLTSLLKQSIGGNTYCTMIACLNPTSTHFQETFQTLTYASMASYISNIPIKNIDPKILQNQTLKQQNRFLKNQVRKLTKNIQQLMKILQQNVCISCKNQKNKQRQSQQQRKNINNNDNSYISKKSQMQSSRQFQNQQKPNYQSRQPAGLIKLPRFQNRKQTSNNQNNIIINNNNKQQIQEQKKILDSKIVSELPHRIPTLKPIKFNSQQQKTLNIAEKYRISPTNKNAQLKNKSSIKTKQQIIQSINMIKQLIFVNSSLRQKVESLNNKNKDNQKEIYYLLRENQILRDRQAMINKVINLENDYQDQKKERNIMEVQTKSKNKRYKTTSNESSNMMIIKQNQYQADSLNNTFLNHSKTSNNSNSNNIKQEKRSVSLYNAVSQIKKKTYNQFLQEGRNKKKAGYKKKKEKSYTTKQYQNSSFY